MSRVLTVGTFDIFHYGHMELLKRCAKFGKLYVGLNTDEFVERYKGKKPILDYYERFYLLFQLPFVESVMKNTGDEDLKIIIEQVKPRYLVVGSDWLKKDYFKQTQLSVEYLEANNITLIYVPRVSKISSSMIKERIKNEA